MERHFAFDDCGLRVLITWSKYEIEHSITSVSFLVMEVMLGQRACTRFFSEVEICPLKPMASAIDNVQLHDEY